MVRGLPSRRALAFLRWLLVGAALGLAPTHAYAQSALSIGLMEPRDGATIHDNEGNVPVAVVRTGRGSIVPLLDGKPFGPPRNATSFVLEGVDRGEHTLQVQLVDADGAVIASSAAVTFYLWRASALFPGRRK